MNEIAFSKALAFTLKEEGGYVNDPMDRGGATNKGITQHTFDTFLHNHGQPSVDVKDITDEEAAAIYAEIYWAPAHCDDYSLPLACAVFDWAVNHGPAGSIRTLQEALMVTADGVYGPKTRGALAAQDQHDDLWLEFNRCRRDIYHAIVAHDPTQAKFLADWLGRVDRLDAYVESL